jgi:hypothetical protein
MTILLVLQLVCLSLCLSCSWATLSRYRPAGNLESYQLGNSFSESCGSLLTYSRYGVYVQKYRVCDAVPGVSPSTLNDFNWMQTPCPRRLIEIGR